MINTYKKEFSKLLNSQITDFFIENYEKDIEITPDNISWDLGFPCFNLSKIFKKSPTVIAIELANTLKNQKTNEFASFEAVWPYINAHIETNNLAKKILIEVLSQKENFWKWSQKNKLILVESPWPNTNKPLHLWHVRNLLLWNSIVNILKFAGYETQRVDIINNRWIHICKSMLAYQKFWNNKQPDKKSDHFVGDRYVEYSKKLDKHPELEQETQEMLIKRENGDQETIQLRQTMNQRAIDWITQTYKRYGTTIDKAYYENDYYIKWKLKVEEEFKKWIFQKDDKWNIIFESKNEHLWQKTVLRADWTSIYSTNDIWVAQWRFEDFNMDKMVYIVWNEQEDYFKVLFEIFEAIWYPFAQNCFHLSYWMISLTSGKMKSREWTVIDADNLADEMQQEAKKIIQDRFPEIPNQELETKSESIALWAIKFFIIKYDVWKNFVFDPKESLSFEWETWPYLQYTYARINSILKKTKNTEFTIENLDFSLLQESEEKKLLLKISEFSEIIQKSAEELKPNLVARFALELAKNFNQYYQKHKIIQENKELELIRVLLIKSTSIVLENCLKLMWISILKEM